MATNFHEVQSPEHFQSLLSEDLSRISLINFWAPWAAPCAQMNEVVLELSKKYPQVLVLQVRPLSPFARVQSCEHKRYTVGRGRVTVRHLRVL